MAAFKIISAIFDIFPLVTLKQVPIFDTNSIIGTIGGSLGLFIGFSFLACVNDLLELISNLLK